MALSVYLFQETMTPFVSSKNKFHFIKDVYFIASSKQKE
jgi:hypothetical protein